MVRLARRGTIDPSEVVVAHLCSRTVDKCFLMRHGRYRTTVLCETLEDSDHTSVRRRIESVSQGEQVDGPERLGNRRSKRDDAFLSPLNLDEQFGGVGPCVSGSSGRCSDKGFSINLAG